jgi:bifunctional enzyme CysN/CysC
MPSLSAHLKPLRVAICASAGDGKSTLIGRLLREARHVIEGQRTVPAREKGMTIGVTYRCFATARRTFIIADRPGHEQTTRDVAIGASTADLAVVLVDARNGVLAQTRRDAFIASLLGIQHVVLAVNKIDLTGYDEAVFRSIAAKFGRFSEMLRFKSLTTIPLSALLGDNVTGLSPATPWYQGPSLLHHLETIETPPDVTSQAFRMPVERVDSPRSGFRIVSGTLAGGRIRTGDVVAVAGSGRISRVNSVVTNEGRHDEAVTGDAVTLTLTDEVELSSGDLLVSADQRPEISDQFAAHLMWMHEEPLLPGRPYLLKIGQRTVTASVTEIKHKEDVNTFQKLAAKTLARDDIGFVNVETHEPVAFDPYDVNRHTGAFLLIDRLSGSTVGAGMIRFGLRRATNVHWQALDVTKALRAELKGQKPCCLWFTGLSGSGKSTIANLLEKKLHAHGRHAFILDGDNTRHGLNRDLGFTDADRVENIRRAAHVAKLMVDAGLIVIVSFISPFEAERRMARELFEADEFLEIFVDTPLEVCEQRDPKGLYRKARAGLIQNFTGISSRYEPPSQPEMRLQASTMPAEILADGIYAYLEKQGYI